MGRERKYTDEELEQVRMRGRHLPNKDRLKLYDSEMDSSKALLLSIPREVKKETRAFYKEKEVLDLSELRDFI